MSDIYDIEERVEQGFKAALVAREVLPEDVTIIMAHENEERKEPCLLISMPDSDIPDEEEDLEYPTGNRQGVVNLTIQTVRDYGRAEHRALVASVRDQLYVAAGDVTTLREEINALGLGVAIDQLRATDSTRAKEDNSYYTVLSVDVVARPVAVEPEE